MTYIDYDMDYWERVLSSTCLAPGITFDQKADFGYQFWPLHTKEKQGKETFFAMSRTAFAVGRNQARPGLLG